MVAWSVAIAGWDEHRDHDPAAGPLLALVPASLALRHAMPVEGSTLEFGSPHTTTWGPIARS